MIFKADLEEWYARSLIVDDDGERAIREASLALSLAVLGNTPSGHDQEHAITRIRETCLLACAARRQPKARLSA